MKKLFAICICRLAFFSSVNAIHADRTSLNYFELAEYIQEQLYYINDQLNDHSLDQYGHIAGYLTGERDAYSDILKRIHVPLVPCDHCKNLEN